MKQRLEIIARSAEYMERHDVTQNLNAFKCFLCCQSLCQPSSADKNVFASTPWGTYGSWESVSYLVISYLIGDLARSTCRHLAAFNFISSGIIAKPEIHEKSVVLKFNLSRLAWPNEWYVRLICERFVDRAPA